MKKYFNVLREIISVTLSLSNQHIDHFINIQNGFYQF